ncbi:MAG: response regulator, partial [Planctomycetota bacterium]|nr:response regulator [Planctomycetota bacterium]
MRLTEIGISMINTAIAIYLQHAYEDEVLRRNHELRFDERWPIERALAEFEKEDKPLASYVLRLGSQHYPHMKMALWEAYFHGEYVFAVDRHDGFDFHASAEDLKAWFAIKAKNYLLKKKIEDAWYEAGLPTLRRLKEERLSRTDVLRAFSGHRILIVDNDPDAAAIVEMILRAEGYVCVRAAGFQEALRCLQAPDASTFGLALVDMLLTDGTGRDVVAAIRQRPSTQDIPVILVSAMNEDAAETMCIDACLRKPYAAQDLVQIVTD